MKKFTAFLLALLLVLSMATTAFAAEEFNGTITVNGAVNGESYTLYKIFDVTTVNGSAAYSIPATNTADVSGLFETNIDKISETESVTYVTRKTTTSDKAIIDWAKDNTAKFGEAVATAVAAEGKVTFINLEAGYYYVASPVSNGAAAMIVDTAQSVSVVEKNSAPGWDKDDETKGGKTADGETYYAGETITYTLTYYSAVNYDKGEQVTKYIIEDTLPAGITYNADVSATVNGETVALTTKETVNNGFKVSIPWTSEDGTSKYTVNPSTIVVTYTATMGNTVIAKGIVNTAKIYPDTNANPGDETEKKDTVYTGKIVLNKVDNNDNTKVLSGAKFKVKVGDKFLKQDGTTFTEVPEAEATTFVTNENGVIELAGLKAGKYILVETEAPAGYNLPANPETEVTLELTEDAEGNVVTTTMSKTQTIMNSKAAAMPETGGMGTTLFYLSGSLMAVCAMVLLITQKRMKVEQ